MKVNKEEMESFMEKLSDIDNTLERIEDNLSTMMKDIESIDNRLDELEVQHECDCSIDIDPFSQSTAYILLVIFIIIFLSTFSFNILLNYR